MDTPALCGSDFLVKLEQLHLLARRLFRGERRAERRSRQLGSSLEFADYRDYTPGDETRNIDWLAYGRLERLFVKLYEHEQDLPISFLIDASASMLWLPPGSPGPTKLDQGRRIAAALAYIGLANLDAANLHFFDDRLRTELGVVRGKSQFHRVLSFLTTGAGSSAQTNFRASITAFIQRVRRPGLAIILSDFFDPDYRETLSMLQHAQFEVHALQILHPAELSPTVLGDLRLRDAETGRILDITVNEGMLRRYREELEKHNGELAAFCRSRAIAHAQITTEIPFEEVVLRSLREGVMIK